MTGEQDADQVLDARTLTLAPDPSSAGLARRFLAEVLEESGWQRWSDTAELACTELVTNALLHARTEVRLSVGVIDDELLVQVADGSQAMPVQRSYDSYATTGRGMALVAALTTEHGIRDAGPAGKTAWFLLRGDPEDLHREEDLLAAWDDATWVEPAPEPSPERPRDAAEELREKGPTVALLGMPVNLWLAAREHHDAVLRELVLFLAEHDGPAVDLAATDRARFVVSTAVTAAAAAAAAAAAMPTAAGSPRPDARGSEYPDGPSAAPAALDLEIVVPADLVACFAQMQDTLDAAERLAIAGQLLAHPGLPEVVAVRDWACEQVIAQHAGAPPSPWSGVDDQQFLTPVAPVTSSDGWDASAVLTSERAVVAADGSNRIVAASEPLARLVGWQVADLVGRRLVTLVPPRLREAHVAGFSRHVTSGRSTILDVPLVLPVLHADGHEVRCRVLIQGLEAAGPSRRLYLAWFDPDG